MHRQSKSQDIVNINQPNGISRMRRIGEYKGLICGVHFEDDLIVILFEYKCSVFEQNIERLNRWLNSTIAFRGTNRLTLTTVSSPNLLNLCFVTNVKIMKIRKTYLL